MTRSADDRGNARGFTLLEVVVAVAIAALALVAMFQAGSTGLFAANSAGRVDEAIERAQSHLAVFGRADTITAGDSEGDETSGYHWRLRARPVRTRQFMASDHNSRDTSLYDVEVMISWHSWGRMHSVVLATRRIGTAAAAQ